MTSAPTEMLDAYLDAERELTHLHRVIVLPLTDASWAANKLNMNVKLNRYVNAERVKFWKELTAATARGIKPLTRARIVAVYRFPDKIRRDVPNWMPITKACVDGLVVAKLLPDDNDKYLVGQDNRADPTRGPVRVTLRIYTTPPEENP